MNMSKMQELYQKVAADSALRNKFTEIMKNAEQAGEEATKEKLIAFAREAGYEVTFEELKEFFAELAESKDRVLSEVELDQVAGGKSVDGILTIVGSVIGLGYACALASIGAESVKKGGCGEFFQ
jgi:predicted ribosomally synthesized peptide with nif11-like leader